MSILYFSGLGPGDFDSDDEDFKTTTCSRESVVNHGFTRNSGITDQLRLQDVASITSSTESGTENGRDETATVDTEVS